jgi:hypothetical protein
VKNDDQGSLPGRNLQYSGNFGKRRKRDGQSMKMGPFPPRRALGKRGGVYPPVAKESVHKDKKLKEIRSFLLDDDGDEGAASD